MALYEDKDWKEIRPDGIGNKNRRMFPQYDFLESWKEGHLLFYTKSLFIK